MTFEEKNECCACFGVGTALCCLALSNAIIIATALLVLGFGEIWFASVVIPTIIVLSLGILFAIITLFLIVKFVCDCLKDKKKKHCC